MGAGTVCRRGARPRELSPVPNDDAELAALRAKSGRCLERLDWLIAIDPETKGSIGSYLDRTASARLARSSSSTYRERGGPARRDHLVRARV